MLRSLEIPDPFATFVANKYANKKSAGYQYDFFGQEWSYQCYTCKEVLYAPNKKDLTKTRLNHTRNECTGGY